MRVEAEAILALNPNNATALLSAGDEEYGRKLAEKALTLAGRGRAAQLPTLIRSEPSISK
jgi:hypothetical protein